MCFPASPGFSTSVVVSEWTQKTKKKREVCTIDVYVCVQCSMSVSVQLRHNDEFSPWFKCLAQKAKFEGRMKCLSDFFVWKSGVGRFHKT